MTGWRKRQVVELAREVKMPYDFVTGEPINLEKLEAFAELVRADEALAQPAPYIAVSNDRINIDPHTGNVSIGTLVQPESKIVFLTSPSKEVIRIDNNGVHINPDFPIDEVAQHVINALDAQIKNLIQAEREACAKVCEDSVEYAGDELARQIRARGQA